MDDSRFDAWTRRRFGLATGGALAAALRLSAFDAAAGKRKKRRKRCSKAHQLCRPDGTLRANCCKGLACNDETNDPNADVALCCRYVQRECDSESQCCLAFACQQAVGLPGKRCCSPFGVFCQEDSDCCAGDGVFCHDLHNCCRRIQAACAADDECCSGLCRDNPVVGGGLHCCVNSGCQVTEDCCFGTCESGACTP